MRASGAIRVLAAALALGAIGFSLGLVVQSQASDQPAPSAALADLQERAGDLIVYSEFGERADTIWAADPNEPAGRVFLATVEHAPGFGITPSLSPDGARVAYTVLSNGATGYGAELWVLETGSGATTRLAQAVDLLATPVWSRTSDAVVARRSGEGEATAGAELLRVDLRGSVTSLASATGGLYAIDFSPDGQSLYYARLSESGSDLMRVSASGGAPERVARLSDGFARDWHLSADGASLAFLAESASGGAAYSTQVLDIASGVARSLVSDEAQFNPVWDGSGALTVGQSAGAARRLSFAGHLRRARRR
ncbi:MAG: hypothetical protein WD939_06930, partial [Dehalococcoidia bacterium]